MNIKRIIEQLEKVQEQIDNILDGYNHSISVDTDFNGGLFLKIWVNYGFKEPKHDELVQSIYDSGVIVKSIGYSNRLTNISSLVFELGDE